MPVLDIPIKDFSNAYSNMELFAVMAYPNDEESRNQYKATFSSMIQLEKFPPNIKEQILNEYRDKKPKEMSVKEWKEFVGLFVETSRNDLERVFSKSGGISTLYNSPKNTEIRSQFDFNCYRGSIAGHILKYIWQISTSKVCSGGSVNKAIFMLEKYSHKNDLKLLSSENKGDNWPYNERFFRQTRKDYKTVSHLWAAWQHWGESGMPEKWSPLGTGLKLSGFISLAEKFRFFGINHVPKAQKTPTLPPEEMWRPLEKFKLHQFDFEIPPLSVEELETVEGYQAPQKL